MRIWLDLAHPPQVLFYRPIIEELTKRGYKPIVTSRASGETIPLADSYGITHIPIGAHGGETLLGKSIAIIQRAIKLAWVVRTFGISLAVGSSYAQAMASTVLRVPLVAFQDYEGHPANHILFRLATKVLVPSAFSTAAARRFGASDGKVQTYNGLKENLYLADFEPKNEFLDKLQVFSNGVIVTARPPNPKATYHRMRNPLFDEILSNLTSDPYLHVVLLPRDQEQRSHYMGMGLQNLTIPDRLIDGPNLIYHSDLVIGAGGTMNRESVVLGTPVYTLFRGKFGSVDQSLVDSGKMIRISGVEDIPKIRLVKKPVSQDHNWRKGRELRGLLVDEILRTLQ